MTESDIRIFRTFAKLIQEISLDDDVIFYYELYDGIFINFTVESFHRIYNLYLDYPDGEFKDYRPIISTMFYDYDDDIVIDDRIPISFSILNDIKTDTDIELVLKYGREILDENIIRNMNNILSQEANINLELKIDDLDNFFDGKIYSPEVRS